MGSNPYNAYKNTQIKTASREQILLMLYDGAIKYMKQGRDALNDENHELAHDKLIQAQDIVTELMASLDMDVGGDVAEDLYSLYDFILHNLVQANVDKNSHRVTEALDVMEDLNDAWETVINERGMTYEKAKQEYEQAGGSINEEDSPPPTLEEGEDGAPEQDTGSQSAPDDMTYGDLSIQG
jgi:flagellar protein FliS